MFFVDNKHCHLKKTKSFSWWVYINTPNVTIDLWTAYIFYSFKARENIQKSGFFADAKYLVNKESDMQAINISLILHVNQHLIINTVFK